MAGEEYLQPVKQRSGGSCRPRLALALHLDVVAKAAAYLRKQSSERGSKAQGHRAIVWLGPEE